ncbi:hypothetical protein Q8W15_03435 [Photobacterium damselae subsp. piscicida]|nr:hypothetical protein [Photobacterium damselae subsp. piscicida]MDP2556642.1 hypothetical protein [Photobacterium damselae subsp. piscicida]MDP2567470.1 hypothetical protein [Photobacterium damselae subsp. piscicida]
MRNLIAGFIAVVIGMFTLFFAAIMGLFVSVAALITKPFLKRKLAYADYAYQEQGFTDSRFGDARQEKQVHHQMLLTVSLKILQTVNNLLSM